MSPSPEQAAAQRLIQELGQKAALELGQTLGALTKAIDNLALQSGETSGSLERLLGEVAELRGEMAEVRAAINSNARKVREVLRSAARASSESQELPAAKKLETPLPPRPTFSAKRQT